MKNRDPVPDPTAEATIFPDIDESIFEDKDRSKSSLLSPRLASSVISPVLPVSPKLHGIPQQRTLPSSSIFPALPVGTNVSPNLHGIPTQRTLPRTCKDNSQLPSRNELIEVLWLLDTVHGSPTNWCPAEVVHVSSARTAECNGTGVIVYPQTDDWDEQVNVVEFLPGYLLRCTAETNDYEGLPGTTPVNENPKLTWRRKCAYGSATLFTSTGQEDRDKDWDMSRIDQTTNQRTSNQPRSERYEREVKSLRTGHATLLVEVEDLKRQFLDQSKKASLMNSDVRDNTICSSVHCVLPRLRYKLALKMQSTLRHNTPVHAESSQSEKAASVARFDGVLRLLMKIRVDCTLDQFENIARHVKLSRLHGRAFFYPDFSQTQLPSLYSDEFRILFTTFSDLCHVIGIDSTADMLEMARRCGSSGYGELLRLVGTYALAEDNNCEPVGFFMGSSCSTAEQRQIASRDPTERPKVPVLQRRTGEWNKVDSRFLNGLQREQQSLPYLPEDVSDLCSFALIWKRSPEVQARMWSKNLHNPLHVFGTLEVRIPCIQTCGRVLCTEFGGLATDEEWISLLTQGS